MILFLYSVSSSGKREIKSMDRKNQMSDKTYEMIDDIINQSIGYDDTKTYNLGKNDINIDEGFDSDINDKRAKEDGQRKIVQKRLNA